MLKLTLLGLAAGIILFETNVMRNQYEIDSTSRDEIDVKSL